MALRTTRALRVGPLGALLPLLAVAGASSIADRREVLNAPPENSTASSNDCVSTAVLQILRGVGTGIAWTISADAYDVASVSSAEWKWYMETRPGSSVPREAAKLLARRGRRNMLGFAGFLCIFSAVSCSLETQRGEDDLLNPFVGGFSAALVILRAEKVRNPRYLFGWALVSGVVSSGLHYFISTKEEEVEK